MMVERWGCDGGWRLGCEVQKEEDDERTVGGS